MPRPKKVQPNSPCVVMFPPKIDVVDVDRFFISLAVRWGSVEKQVKLSREQTNLIFTMIDEINKALLEASESKPYDLK